MMQTVISSRLIDFLRDELSLSTSSIDIALRRCDEEQCQLPIILWRYGLVTLDQLAQIFDWQERV